ncbi:unnamed protein product [Polarella glacialis]|uniref:B30.2/SPRY domain-containing protein n=1 Tax=Polarella glacialis TaxID=89957 RepID=A0A813FXR8_POLGL|nr:unnamed protein product [Polarella glacialis]
MDISSAQQLRLTESEALIESSFRRLIASIESERSKIHSTWSQIEEEQTDTSDELERLKLDTEEWCHAERAKIDNQWKRIDKLRENMSVLWTGDKKEVLQINCSGSYFSLPKRLLSAVEGSYLNHMFSDSFIKNVPRDSEERFFLDFNPDCFAIVIDWLKLQETKRDEPPPQIPAEQQQNMDLLAQALNLKPFLRLNAVSQSHATSLRVRGNEIEATHMGWQVITAEAPLKMSGNSYFEVHILVNPDPKTDRLAIGVCGHVPQGTEAHSIRIRDSILYNSNVGLIGPSIEVSNVAEKLQFAQGSVIGVKHEIATRTLHFYFNRLSIGSCSIKAEALERMQVMYPIFALHVPEQKIHADFSLNGPMGSRSHEKTSTLDKSAMKSSSPTKSLR